MAAGYYNPNKDYSQAILDAQKSGASQATINQLQQERQNKIDAVYGGKEPTMTGSDKTFSQTYGGGSSGSSSSGASGGVYGVPVIPKAENQDGLAIRDKADMSRRPELANSYAVSGGYTVFYDQDGYAYKAVKGLADYTPHQDYYVQNGSYQGGNLWTDEEVLTAADLAKVQTIRQQLSTGAITADQANALANQIRSGYGYTIDKAGNVTDLGALATVDARRQQWGLPTNGATQEQINYLQAMFPELGTDDINALLGAQLGLVNGTYTPGSAGAYGSGLDGGTLSFEDFLAQTGYDQYSAATQQRIQAAVQQAVNGYNAQIEQANKDTEELARQAYIASMLGQKNLDQQLSAAGYAGGMADSQRIQMQSNYENNLRDLETQRLEVVAELERAIQDAQLTGDIQSAQELQSYLQQMQGSWLSYVQNQQAMAQQDYWNRQQMTADQQNTAYNRALQMLSMGVMPGTDLLTQASLSQQEAEAIRASVLAELGSGTTGTTASTTGAPRSSGGTYDNGSLTASQVRQLQQALGVTADGMWGRESTSAAGGLTADEAWAAMHDAGNTISVNRSDLPEYDTVLQNSGAGAYGIAYGLTLSTVQAMLSNNATRQQVETYLLNQLNAGNINELGAATILQALGIEAG